MNKLALLRFDVVHGLPAATGVLRQELGGPAAAGVLLAFLIAGVRDPFRGLEGGAPCARERFTRHQLRPVLILDAVLRRTLPPARVLEILAKVVERTGARFVAQNVEHPDPEIWQTMGFDERRGFAERVLTRFGNAETTLVDAGPHDFAFDVTRCHFVDLTHRLGRPELAPLFCAADSAFYGDPSVPIDLTRRRTLAGGDNRCTFRFDYRAPDPRVDPATGSE